MFNEPTVANEACCPEQACKPQCCVQMCVLQCCDPCGIGNFYAGAEWLYWKAEEANLFAGSFDDDFPVTFYENPCALWEFNVSYSL